MDGFNKNSQNNLCESADPHKEAVVNLDYNLSTTTLNFSCKADYEFLEGTTTCVSKKCSDGVIDVGEECNDANRLSDDGCTYDCKKENYTDKNEERRRADNKSEVCVSKECGDAIVTDLE